MAPKPTIERYFWIIFIVLLVACGTLPTEQAVNVPTSMPTFMPVLETPTALPTFTPRPPTAYTVVSGDTCESIADAFKVSIESIIDMNNLPSMCLISPGQQLFIPYPAIAPIRPSSTPSPIPTPISKFPLNGYIMTFIKDGDLFFQDGDHAPARLSHVGENANSPEISPDNQKILFYRTDGNKNIPYLINTDGTDERIVMPQDWLDVLEPGTGKDVSGFIPNNHQLLLITYLCQSQDPQYPCLVRLFIADTDAGKINNLADFDMPYYYPSYYRNIEVSPNGKMIAVGTINGIDIFALDGKIIRESILPYKPATGIIYPLLFWLPDSSGLIIALPDKIYDNVSYDNVVAYSVWGYSVADDGAVEIPMDVPPMASEIEISPDRNWAVYGGFGDAERSLYLADLTTGHVQIFGEDAQPIFSWGLDSRHFVYGTALQNMSTVDNPFSTTTICGYGKWIDVDHFTCYTLDKSGSRLRIAKIDGEIINIYDLGLDKKVEPSVFIKPK